MNDVDLMTDYEIIIESYKIIKKIKSIFYGNFDSSRLRENEAHYYLGMLDLLLWNQIKDEDEDEFKE